MSFGQKILEKYGFKKGAGLGKNENGITEPIKAKFKFDNTGLGDTGPVRDDHWWERVFNEASNNVKVQESNGTTRMELHDEDGVEITNKSFSLKKLKETQTSLHYGSFLKSATLLANVGTEQEIEGHVSTNDIEIKPIQVLSDEDLFRACNGRTAHKGARHGLNLSGKLQRIAEQEKLLLEKMKGRLNKHEVFREPILAKKRKPNPLVELNSSRDDETSDDNQLPVDTESDYILKASKKRKKRDKSEERNLVKKIKKIGLEPETPSKMQVEDEERKGTPVRKPKKSKHIQKLALIQETEQSSDEPRKKKKIKRKLEDPATELPAVQSLKKKKKKKEKVKKFRQRIESTCRCNCFIR